ncbi:MAG: hypothetical protein K0R00_1352 [Herbinix sp.]|jgi:hypothetical protein|nr:hypothetical protein [Herbinix sp.]
MILLTLRQEKVQVERDIIIKNICYKMPSFWENKGGYLIK